MIVKLSWEDVLACRRAIADGTATQIELCRKYGVAPSTMSKAVRSGAAPIYQNYPSRRKLPGRERLLPRRCLAPGHDHLFLTTKAVRLCNAGRKLLADVDPYFNDADPVVAGFAEGRHARRFERTVLGALA